MLRICEVCGCQEEMEETEAEMQKTNILHLCENCQNDRRMPESHFLF